MKRILSAFATFFLFLSTCTPVSAVVIQTPAIDTLQNMSKALLVIFIIGAVLLLSCVLITLGSINRKKGKRRRKNPGVTVLKVVLYVATIIVLLCAVFCLMRYRQVKEYIYSSTDQPAVNEGPNNPSDDTQPPSSVPSTSEPTADTSDVPVPPEVLPPPTLTPVHTEDSDPANWDVNWQLQVNGELVDNYQSPDTYNFTYDTEYFALPGIASFRGNNYRTGASYGIAEVSEQTLTKKWCREVGSLNGWPGIGWTGQPLCVQWDDETKNIMNLYSHKKEKDGLVEVIATTLDGYIYFYDLDDGTYTRDPMWIGMSFKGTASLDPRGYPILYAGSGLTTSDKYPRMYVISLIDCSILMEKSGGDDFALRGWYAFDSSPMISADTDTLFWPGESGVLYTIKLNTQYDKANGTLSMSPETIVKARYSTSISHTIGYEASTIIVGNYMYIGDNGGMFYCIDLHTMQLVWTQYIKDDLNATPVFEWSADGQGYLYLATSMEYSENTVYIYKINASTGEFIWTKTYDNVVYDYDVSGGALSSPVLGKAGTDLEGLVIFSIAKTPSAWSGTLVALDTETGNVVWEKSMNNYAWSSPVSIYTESGKGYLVMGDAAGYIYLIDGSTGNTLYTEGLGSNIEASPVVFNNKLVVGTRGCQVWGVVIE